MFHAREHGVWFGAVSCVAASLVSFDAHAQDEEYEEDTTSALEGFFVSPGFVWSWSPRPTDFSGPGVELSAGYSPISGAASYFDAFHVGLVYRGQSYSDAADDFFRHTIAAEAGLPLVGVELGYDTHGAADAVAAFHGVHIAPYLSLGVLYLGPAWTLSGSDSEVAFNLGVKAPWPTGLEVLSTIGYALSFAGADHPAAF
jgi:hypothetical protein